MESDSREAEPTGTDTTLRRSEALHRAMLEAALDPIITITGDSRVIEWNLAAERTFGYSTHQALGQDLAQLIIPPEFRERHYRGMARYLATGQGPVIRQRVELEALRSDGLRFPVELAISPITIEGQPHFTAYLRDITERRRAEAALRESEQRLRSTYEHAFAGIAEVDRDGHYLQVNEEFSVITGYSRQELLERTFHDITHPDDKDEDLAQFRRQMAGEIAAYEMEKRYIHKDGHVVWIELASSTVHDAAGRPLYSVRVARDITERKHSEEHLRLLVHELNHRVKNTLMTVQSMASQTLRNAATLSEARRAFEERLLALSRAHNILTRENWEGARLGEVVEQAVEPYRDRHRNRFHLGAEEVRLAPRMALALSLALQELVTNAVRHGALSNETGEVEISWRVGGATGAPRLELQWRERGGPTVQPPLRRGFGSRLIERSLAQDLDGEVQIAFNPEGLVCTVDAPL